MDLVNRLSYLFGTEEEVKRRRHLVLLREEIRTKSHNISEGCVCDILCSGSLGEGVVYPKSDDDLMFVRAAEHLHVYDRSEEATNHRALYMIPSVYSPGFCIIQATTAIGLPFLSSKNFRENFVRHNPTYYSHGPCASAVFDGREYDYAKCLLCPRWPTVANEWITRRRGYGWPKPDLVANIVKAGCHAVPIGNPDSPLCDLEWRMSFSLAERSLIHAFNHVQFLVYNLLKLILKRVIAVQVKDVLCSYFLKTVLYYTIERTGPEIWRNDAIDECYRECLVLLYHFIDAKNCPNYFVPDNNMMRRKVNENNKLQLLPIVRELMTCGIVVSLRLCGERTFMCPLLSHAHNELKVDQRFLMGYNFSERMAHYDAFIVETFGNDVRFITASNVLSPILSCYKQVPRRTDSSFLNLIFKQVCTRIGLQCIEISTRMTDRNASRYQILKNGQAMLKVGRNTDVCSGRLQLANFMFMTGRYRHCLSMIQAVLSDIAPYVITRFHSNEAEEMYMDVICNNGHSLDYRVRKAWGFKVEFGAERAKFAPFPCKFMFAVNKYATSVCPNIIHPIFHFRVDPLVFAYYLQGFCFHQTRDVDSMNNSIMLLIDSIANMPKCDLCQSFNGRLLLGHLRMLQQDYRSSFRYFISAYFIKNAIDRKYNDDNIEMGMTCLFLISCLLNRIALRR